MIILLGYMGSGKSTLGRGLADAQKSEFVDLDERVEAELCQEISDFIADRGELRFRQVEHKVLREILDRAGAETIIALGGGTPVFYNHMELLNAKGTTLFLDVSVGELVHRLKDEIGTRPLLQSKDDLAEFIAKHLFERRSYYQEAKLRVQSDALTVKELGQKIADFTSGIR